ncbi:hypothetical protein EV360DRAFT_72722 [Lentinula raphanica]|nr:hypothetical protein EV360DRAFT_72722 [Lentinula raphanica]
MYTLPTNAVKHVEPRVLGPSLGKVTSKRAARGMILPVVERSVTIAVISTQELVAKDLATESNEEKMRKAWHLIAQRSLEFWLLSPAKNHQTYPSISRRICL